MPRNERWRRDKTRWCKSPNEMPKEIEVGAVFPTLMLIIDLLENIMSDLSDLQDQVAASVGIEQSAITLIQGLASKIDALVAAAGGGGVDPAALQALTKNLNDSAKALSDAITAGARPDAPTDTSGGTQPAGGDSGAPAGDAAPTA